MSDGPLSLTGYVIGLTLFSYGFYGMYVDRKNTEAEIRCNIELINYDVRASDKIIKSSNKLIEDINKSLISILVNRGH